MEVNKKPKNGSINYNPNMLTIILQAGGASTRMGSDKALLPFLGVPLIKRLKDRFMDSGTELMVITNSPADYEFLNLPLHQDLIPGRGALGGLFTALSIANNQHVGLIAADMPFASPRLITALDQEIRDSGADAVLPSTPLGLEPMHAVYRRDRCLSLVKDAIENDLWKMNSWHGKGNILIISPEETREITKSDHTFWNLNTPEDFQKAEQLALLLGME
jgi:molybdopterin-guanine dinucleotide biosynthesis protein A